MPRLFLCICRQSDLGVLFYITCQTSLASCYSPWSWSTLVLHSGQQTDLVSGALLHNLPNFSCLLLCSLVDFPHNCTLRVKQQQQWNWFATLQNISAVSFIIATLPQFIFCPAMHNTSLKPRMPEMHLPINWTDGREWESQLMQPKVINFHPMQRM